MTQLEKLQDNLKNYEATYTGMFDCNSAVQYNVIYQRQALTELLDKEIPTMNHRKEYIDNIVDLACIKHCASVVDELATKYVSQNVSEINNVLKNTFIKEEEILKHNEDAFQAFYNTEVILNGLTYKNDLIASFERFLRRRHIKLSLGNPEYRFCFTFTCGLIKNDEVTYHCNNVYEFLKFCPIQMLDECCNELISMITAPSKTVQNYPTEQYDLNIIASLSGKELYEYLASFEFMRINYDIEDLYLLLYYEEIPLFKNDDIMEILKLKIINRKP